MRFPLSSIILTVIGSILSGLVIINLYFVRTWIEQTSLALIAIQKDVKSLELRVTQLASMQLSREEIRTMIIEASERAAQLRVREHEREFHNGGYIHQFAK